MEREELHKIVIELIKSHGITAYEIEQHTHLSAVGVQKIINGETKRPTVGTLETIINYIKSKTSGISDVSNVTEKVYKNHIPVKLVPIKARAGWTDEYYADAYLESMPIILMESDKAYRGNYLAFEVDGDSMEPDYHTGDIVICREVKRDLWRYKLHIDQYDFVIAHSKNGIFIKEITNHNIETGDITCHSLNDENKDFVINLNEVAHLYNIVEVRESGKNKKQRRK